MMESDTTSLVPPTPRRPWTDVMLAALCVVWTSAGVAMVVHVALEPSEHVCSIQDIDQSKVKLYMQVVYNASVEYDLCTLSVLYKDVLSMAGLHIPFSTKHGGENSTYDRRVWLDSRDFGFVYHAARTPLANSTWIEVTHCVLAGETDYFWMYHSPGSGVWYNTGDTISFDDHVPLEPLRARGLTSVQFVYRADQYGSENIAVEVVDLHHRGTGPCGPPLRAGLHADNECVCFGDVRQMRSAEPFNDWGPFHSGYTMCSRCAQR